MFDFLFIAAMSTLADLDRLFKNDDFDSSFHESDRAVVEFQSCVGKQCEKWKLGFLISVKTPASAVISTYDGDGNEIANENMFKNDWDEGKHNRIRIKLANLKELGFKTEVKNITKFSKTILLNGQNKTVDTYVVDIDATKGTKSKPIKEKLLIEVVPGLGGLGQMLKTSEFKGSNLETYEVKELEYHPNGKTML
jgi:hypothetical protein